MTYIGESIMFRAALPEYRIPVLTNRNRLLKENEAYLTVAAIAHCSCAIFAGRKFDLMGCFSHMCL